MGTIPRRVFSVLDVLGIPAAPPSRPDAHTRVMAMAEAPHGKSGVRFWRLKDLPQVELYHAADRTRANPRHVHTVFSMTVAERGVGIHRTGHGAYAMAPGSIAIVNCGESHSGDVPPGRNYSSRTIRLAPDLIEACLSQVTGAPCAEVHVRQPVIHDLTLARSLLRLFDVLEQPGTGLEKEYRLLENLAALCARHGRTEPCAAVPRGDERACIRRACTFLRDRFAEHVSLDQLASLAGMSPFHFAKVFTRQVGVPPHAFQIHVRLQRATDLLAMGKSHVETALETGFCDQSHFCRAFKKKFGVTPAQYRH